MMDNPRAVIGHNEPPLADRLALDHADLVKRATEAAALVPEQIRAIETDEEATAYTDTAGDIQDVIADADKAFTGEKEPWLTGGRTVDDFFRFRVSLKAAVDRTKKALNVFQAAKLAAARKAEAAEQERARKEAIAFDEPVPVAAPVVVKEAARVVSFSGAKASASVKWKPRVVDFEKVPREYLIVNERALQAKVDGLKAQGGRIEDAKIPGVEIYEDLQTSIRR
jgi:hypothetical protein